MEYLVCQQRPFVVYSDWNMTPQRFQEEAKCWLTEMKAEFLGPKDGSNARRIRSL